MACGTGKTIVPVLLNKFLKRKYSFFKIILLFAISFKS
jgi:hypothetical protein